MHGTIGLVCITHDDIFMVVWASIYPPSITVLETLACREALALHEDLNIRLQCLYQFVLFMKEGTSTQRPNLGQAATSHRILSVSNSKG
jgi:hypothetical protein